MKERFRSGRPRRRPESGDPEEMRADRRSRSLEEPLDVRARPAEPFVVLEVRNPVHRTQYLVVVPAYPAREGALCTCTDFARRGIGTCKHLEAAMRWLESNELPPGPPRLRPAEANAVWQGIDERLARSTRDDRPSAIRFRDAGRLLIG